MNETHFIKAIITQLQRDYSVDRNRIYVTGVSNGGMLAYKLGVELSDIIAAIAPVAGCMYQSEFSKYPVSVIAFNGTADSVIPYNGGTGYWFGFKVHATSTAETIQHWVQNNRCDPQAQREEFGCIHKETYTNGASHTEVCLYTIEGGRHVWPGGRSAIPIWSPQDRLISATDLMWDFFREHPKAQI